MIKGYETKDMKAPEETKMTPPEKDGMWFFKWKGGECGYHSQSDAEAGLKKLSGNGES